MSKRNLLIQNDKKEDDIMAIIVGSARSDEDFRLTGGTVGDQRQESSTNDKEGEVSMQNMYKHTKGWYILRPKNITHANKMAELMKKACNNKNIGYDQNGRYGIIKYGISTTVKTECDCSSLVRQVIKEATGKDVGDFNTSSEASVLEKSGLFMDKKSYVSQSSTPVYDGDVLVTKTKGHTVIVVSGNPRNASTSASTSTTSTYTLKQFIKDVQKACGAEVDGIAGKETLSKTVTVSAKKNSKHAVVKAIQKRLNALGYSCGEADGIAGSKFTAAVNKYQKNVLKYSDCDGEITAKGKMWKSLLGMK